MKNIFDYAEKELSQDGFLCWLFDSFDDPIIGEASRRLIVTLANAGPNRPINSGEISDVEAHKQSKHIDIVVDFKIGGTPFLLAIEDKTTSEEHDQLHAYNNAIKKWNTGENIERKTIKIFYKTTFIDEAERKRVEDNGWTVFDINKIADFFSPYQDSKDEILSSYAKHVVDLQKQQTTVAFDKPMNDWSFLEARTYMSHEIVGKWNELHPDKTIGIWNFLYQGRYYSAGLYFSRCGIFMPCLEIFFRKNEPINATIHIGTTYHKDGKKWDSWKKDPEVSEPYWRSFYDKFKKSPMPSFKSRHYVQCVASIKERIEKTATADVTPVLMGLISEFYDFFDTLEPNNLSGETKQ